MSSVPAGNFSSTCTGDGDRGFIMISLASWTKGNDGFYHERFHERLNGTRPCSWAKGYGGFYHERLNGA
jgi:hypothetical protein